MKKLYDVKLSDLKNRDQHQHGTGFKTVADISTSHMTGQDAVLLSEWDSRLSIDRASIGLIGSYEYGYAMRAPWDEETLEQLKSAGFSAAFRNVLVTLREAAIHYVFFDQDGYVVDEFETFEW